MTLLKASAFLLLILLQVPLPENRSLAQTKGYRALILQYVRQDKVYLLEKLRPRVTNKSEQTVIDALLTEDGPVAAGLFHKQLTYYPDPALDSLSKARLLAYRSALFPAGQQAAASANGSYYLQFGSFSSLHNAQKLANRIKAYTAVTIFSEKGLHKVRTRKGFSTKGEAAKGAKKLPFPSMTVRIN